MVTVDALPLYIRLYYLHLYFTQEQGFLFSTNTILHCTALRCECRTRCELIRTTQHLSKLLGTQFHDTDTSLLELKRIRLCGFGYNNCSTSKFQALKQDTKEMALVVAKSKGSLRNVH